MSKENKQVKLVSKIISKVTPVLQVIIALLALMILLGLAVKGAGSYLSNIDDKEKLMAAVVIVVLLAYSIGTGLKRIVK